MKIALVFLFAHILCSLLFSLCATLWKINKRWVFLFTALFFICPTAVFLVLGPHHLYLLYVAAFVAFLALAKATELFYIFLKTQEDIMRYFFWLAVLILSLGLGMNSMFEINLRRNAIDFWKYEAQHHPSASSICHLADAYDAARNNQAAEQYYAKAISLDPKLMKPYVALIQIDREKASWDQMVKFSKKVISLNPQDFQAYLDLGEAYRMLDQSAEAVETYSKLLDLFPDDEQVHIKVIEAYGEAIAHDPGNDLYKEKREEVLADSEQLSRRKNYTAMDYYNLAFLYEQVGGKDEAMRFYAKALQMQPNMKDALFNLANLYRDSGNYKAAIELYARLVHFHPQFALGYLNMGIIFNAVGDQERARRLYLKVIKLDPDNGDAYFNLGYLCESQGQFNDAVNYYEKAVEVAPKNAEAYYNLGNVYANLGQNGEAIAAYLKTVGINPKHMNAYVNLSILSFKSGDFQGAIHYLEEAQSLGYNPPDEYLKTLEPYRK